MADGNKTIGYNIAATRGKAGESQADLAAALNVKREMVTYWENATRPVKVDTIIAIAKRYNVSADYLLGLCDYPTVEKDMKIAQKVTGLSEKAIANATSFEPWVASRVMETDGFPELIVDICQLNESIVILEDLFSEIKNGTTEPCGGDSQRNPNDLLIQVYDLVRLNKYELRDSFASIIEKAIPSAQILSEIKAYLREYGGLSASDGRLEGESSDI